ncbi:hypothetical protein DFH07DRAFT_937891 [Mycena maculata]|uniref:Uncharacterized protein n=1 Tax=Mycena maculata TaxID=230809 RepID=A0AAD7JSL7_9AGAR|nr:hypothetical protein DFH07DRAFT_937891 [Mycena maculata]
MPTLTPAKQEIAEAQAQQLFSWEILVEEHSAVLRADANRFAEAYQTYAATAPLQGSLPPPADSDRIIKESEETLERLKGCTPFIKAYPERRLTVVNTAMLLCRMKMQLFAADYSLALEISRLKNALYAKHVFPASSLAPMVIPADPHPLLRELGIGAPANFTASIPTHSLPETPEYLPVLPGPVFASEDVDSLPHAPFSPAEIQAYQNSPDSLLDHTFIPSEPNTDLDGPFKVSAILTTAGPTRIFYVVFADGTPDAYYHRAEDFFDLLASSERSDVHKLAEIRAIDLQRFKEAVWEDNSI